MLPGIDLLNEIPLTDQSKEYKLVEKNVQVLERTFDSFGVDAKVVRASLGPSVTKFEIQPAVGVKVSKIVGLTDDLALALAAKDIRMEAPIPGKSLIGIEVQIKQLVWFLLEMSLSLKKVTRINYLKYHLEEVFQEM